MGIRRRGRALVVVGVAAAMLSTGTVAYAVINHWISVRSEVGWIGSAPNLQDLSLPAPKPVYDPGFTYLWPGHSVGMKFTASNPNPVPVRIIDMEINGFYSKCHDLLWLGVGGNITDPVHVTPGQLPTTAIAPGGSIEFTIPNVVTLPESASQTCDGHSFRTAWKISINPA